MDQKLAPGSSLGPYKIIRLIGQGGMGEVYEAYEELLQRSVALKIITDQAITQIPEVLRLFITEGKALAQLNHPNVVTIYQLGHDKGIHYIAMEYIEGTPLDEYIQKNKPDFKRDLAIFYRILLGVQALHKKGIIHRDLKPKNVIISGTKVVKIVDFGIAEILREPKPDDQQPGVLMGSVYYMSPEVSQGRPATFQSDIWSLGVLLYQLVTRQRPFTGKSQTEILGKIRHDDITFPAVAGLDVPSHYKEMAAKMCRRSLSERYQTIDEIIQDLGVVSKEPATQSRRTEAFLISTVTLILTVLVGWQIVKGKSGSRQPAATERAPIKNPTTTTSTTTTTTTIAAAVSTTSTTLESRTTVTTVPPVEKTVEKPKVANSANLPTPKLKAIREKIVLQFKKEGSSSRNPASLAKALINPPTLTWQSVAKATGYQIQISQDPDFAKNLVNKKVESPPFKWDTPVPGELFWRVQAISSSRKRSDFSDGSTMQIQLPAPKLSQPLYKISRKTAQADGSFHLEWAPSPLVSAFQLKISKKNSPTPVVDEIVTGLRYKLAKLSPGDYEVQVTALDSKRLPASAPSAKSSLQIAKPIPLPSPQLKQPSDGIIVPSQGTMITPIACSWSAISKATQYEYQLASDAGFKTVLHQTTTAQSQYVLTMPLPKGKFFWRVRATSQEEEASSWSRARTFKID
jgi:serine/threonine protein kinase